MNQILEVIFANVILISFFFTLKFRVKFQNDKLASVILVQLLLAYNFYIILAQCSLGRIVNLIALFVLIAGMIISGIVAEKLK